MRDVVAAGVWFCVTLSMGSVAWSTSRVLFPRDSATQRAIHVVVLVWSWVMVACALLGSVGLLGAGGLGGGVSILAITSLCGSRWLCRRNLEGSDSLTAEERPQTAFVEGQGGDRSAKQSTFLQRLFPRLFVWFWRCVAGLAVVLVAFRGLGEFPNDWDTLMYHRPLMNLWLQTGSLYVPQCAVWYNPSSYELLGLWWAAPFSGDFWVGLMSLPVAVLLGCAAYEVCRLFGLSPAMRHATTLAIISGPVVSIQLVNAKNDVAVCALFLAGLFYGIRYVQDRRGPDLIMAAMACGLLAGVKYYALGYAAMAWLGFSVIVWYHRGLRAAVVAATLVVVAMQITGGYWYLRNYAVTGSPLHPSGHSENSPGKLESGRNQWRSTLIGSGQPDVWPQYVEAAWKRGGITQTVAIMALPTTLLWLTGAAWLYRRKNSPYLLRGAVRCGLMVMLIGSWLTFGVTPYAMSQTNEHLLDSPYLVIRFSQTPLALSVIALSVLLSDLGETIATLKPQLWIKWLGHVLPPLPVFVTGLMSFVGSATVALKDDWLLQLILAFDVALILAAISFIAMRRSPRVQHEDAAAIPVTDGVGPVVSHETAVTASAERVLSTASICRPMPIPGRLRSVALAAVVLIALVSFATSTHQLATWWHRDFATHYDTTYRTTAFTTLENWPESPPAIVALHYRYYPFFGSKRQFHASRPRRIGTKEALFDYVDWHGANVVAAMNQVPFRFANYDTAQTWLIESPAVFTRIDTGSSVTLYRVNRSALRSSMSAAEVVATSDASRDADAAVSVVPADK